jgi:hypothetical protein
MIAPPDASLPLTAVAPGRWRTTAGPEWANPTGTLWGGYAVGLCVRALEAEPQAVGEALSLTLTYAAAVPAGELDVRTRRLRQGGSIGVWEVEMLPAGSDLVGVHGVVTMAKRPPTPPYAFLTMPADAPDPDSLPTQDLGAMAWRPGWAATFDRRFVDGFPPEPGHGSRTLAWVRSQCGPLDRALLGMLTDMSPPRAFYALGRNVRTTTLSLSAYLYATAEDLAAVGEDFILIECDGSVGAHGASGERSSYWSRDGKLLATSEQLVWYREVKENLPE